MRNAKVLILVAICALVAVEGWAQVPTREFTPVQLGHRERGDTVPLYRPGRLLVQFTRDATGQIDIRDDPGKVDGGILTGIASVDQIHASVVLERAALSHPHVKNARMAADLGVDRWYELDYAKDTDLEALADRLRRDPHVEAVSFDWVAFPHAVPNDPEYPTQWGHNNTGQMLSYCWGCGGHPGGSPVGSPGFDTNAQAAWDESQGYGSPGVVIAILDTGVNLSHPDLAANLVPGYDYGDNDPIPEDDSASPGHGTACAGVAAAVANNGVGVSGIAGGCSIMPIKVADSNGALFFSYIQDGLYHAADNGADVVSMSFGASISSDPATDTALQYAANAGVIMFSTTGNDNATSIGYPANNVNVVSVGAASNCGDRKRSSSNSFEVNPGVFTDPNGYTCDGERWWGSNYGATTPSSRFAVDLLAPTINPTTDIQGAGGYQPGNYETWFNGTSSSCPYAAGVAALVLSADPSMTRLQVEDHLKATAIDIVNVESEVGWDRYSGWGMVDAGAAVAGLGGGCTPPTAGFSGSPTSGNVPLTVQFTDQSTGDYDTWSWTFGDGGTSSAQNPQYTYFTAGTYAVSLTVSGSCGSDTETKTGYVTVTDPGGGGGVVGEIGVITRNQTGAGADWYVANLDNTYSNPAVIMKALTTNGGHKTHLRVRNAGSASFEWQQEEWDYLDGNHTTEDCPYLVMESGTHTLEDGTLAEAGKVSVGTGWTTVNFAQSFASTPMLQVGVMTESDGAAVVSRTRNLTATGFQVKLQEEEAADGIHANEIVGWVAIEQGTGSNDGRNFEASRTPNAVTHQWYSQSFSRGIGDGPVFLAHDDTYNGGNTCSTRYRNLNAGGVEFFIEEEQSKDNEVNHIAEVVSWLVWSSAGDIVAASAKQVAFGGDVEVDQTAPKLAFGLVGNRPNPFNPSTNILFRLPTTGRTRLEVYDLAGRRVRTLANEVMTAGEHTIAWNGRDQGGRRVASGVYVYRLVQGALVETKRMTLIK